MVTKETPARKGIAQTVRFRQEPEMKTGIDMAAMPARQMHRAMPTTMLAAVEGGPGTTPMMGTVAEYPLARCPNIRRTVATRNAQTKQTFAQDGFLIFTSSCELVYRLTRVLPVGRTVAA